MKHLLTIVQYRSYQALFHNTKKMIDKKLKIAYTRGVAKLHLFSKQAPGSTPPHLYGVGRILGPYFLFKGRAFMNGNLAYQDEFREELINGEVVAMSPAATNHNRIARNISRIFGNYLFGQPCEPFADGEAVYLTESDHFIPDFMVVCDPDKVKDDGVHGAPDLVVEVLSHSTAHNDRGRKMDVYAQCGVQEYWIVIPGEKSIEQYVQKDGRLALLAIHSIRPDFMLKRMSDTERAAIVTEFKCSLFDDLVIHLSDVFERVK